MVLSCQSRVVDVVHQLRPYQVGVFNTMVRDKRHLNYMDMGLGKTLVTMTSVMRLEAFPCIIVCPKSAMGVWQEELMKWYGEPSTLYVGKPKQRKEKLKEFANQGHKFIITNYSLIKELGETLGIIRAGKTEGSGTSGNNASRTPHTGTKWRIGALVADEIQLGGLFNHKTQTYKTFKALCKEIDVVYLLTGTPYRKGVIDFFGPLSLVDRERFDSYWKYVNKYCMTIDTGFGKSIERNPKNVVQFRAMLREYASVLKKTDYLHELPGKQRQAIPVEMEGEQKRVYDELTEELYSITDGGELVMTPGVLSLTVRQRQLLVAPQVLGLESRGAAIDTLLEMGGELVEDRKPFVVFTPFRKAVPYIKDALIEKFGRIPVFEITGGLTTDEFTERWQGFQNSRGPGVLICVIKSGASFHATRADTAFFLGYEWDFNQNEQAEDRLYRIGQKNMVNCYYLMHKGTVDEEVGQKLNDKKFTSELILSSEEKFTKMLLGKRER